MVTNKQSKQLHWFCSTRLWIPMVFKKKYLTHPLKPTKAEPSFRKVNLPLQSSYAFPSLEIIPFKKSLMHLHTSCPQVGMLTWQIRIINCKWHQRSIFFSRLLVSPMTRCGKSLSSSVLPQVFDKSWEEQQADGQWTYAQYRHWSLIAMHNCIL